MTEFIRNDYAAVFGRGTRGDPKLKELSDKYRYCPQFRHQLEIFAHGDRHLCQYKGLYCLGL